MVRTKIRVLSSTLFSAVLFVPKHQIENKKNTSIKFIVYNDSCIVAEGELLPQYLNFIVGMLLTELIIA